MENNGTNNTVSGETITFNNSTTNTFTISFGGEITTESFEFKETSDGNFIEVVKRQKPYNNITYTTNWGVVQKDKIWKEIYGVSFKEDGTQELQLLKTINAEVIPAHHVEESIEFEE